MKSNPSQDLVQRDIREWTNASEKEHGHSQPKGKSKGKGKRKHSGKGNHNQDQAVSPNEENGQRTLGDFGLKRQRVEFVGDFQESDVFQTPKVDRAAFVFCVHKCENGLMDSTELPTSSTRVFQVCRGVRSQRALMRNRISPQEKCSSPLDVEKIDQ